MIDETMEDLLNESELIPRMRTGDIINGIVVAVDQDGLLISIGNKSEGLIPSSEMLSAHLDESISITIGSQVSATVLETEGYNGSAILSLDRAREKLGWDLLETKIVTGEQISGRITGFNRGGAVVDVGGVRGFIPLSHISRGYGRTNTPDTEMESRIGELVNLKIIEANRSAQNAVLSEKMFLEEQREIQKNRIIEQIHEGDIVQGKVSSICEFGAFVDIGGADGLLHISELSWDQVPGVGSMLRVDDPVEVSVIKIDKENKRIGLSLKRITPEPWLSVPDRYHINQIIEAQITRVTDFGAFARVEGSIEGLIHISELSYNDVQHPSHVVKEGEYVALMILNIDPERKRLALSLRQADHITST